LRRPEAYRMSRIDNANQIFAEEEEAKIDLTPMLDVVFIMLIFFIVTATFINEIGLDANKPPEVDIVTTESKSITIQITANDEIRIDGLNIDKRSVASQIVRRKAENPKASVAVLAHSKSTADTLVSVIDAIKEAGVDESVPINEFSN
jgi:biopolymer transport protein ExbD